MFKNYKRMYIEVQGEKEFYKNMKDYYKKLLDISSGQINYYREQIAYCETACKKMKRSSNIGFGCGIASLVIVTIISILKAVIK